jgi:magnesium transporter
MANRNLTEALLTKLKEKVDSGASTEIEDLLAGLYPADIANLLEELSQQELKAIFPYLPLEKIAFSLMELEPAPRQSLVKFLTTEQLKVVLDTMYPDDAADLLGSLSIGKSKELLDLMRREDAKQVEDLLGYDEESAGGVMTTEYIAVKRTKTAGEALATVRKVASQEEMIYYIYVVDENKKLVGALSLRELITAAPEEQIINLMQPDVIKVELNLDQEEAAAIISKYDLLAAPVVNKKEQLLGIITVDDIIDVIEEEATEDIYKLGATATEAEPEVVEGSTVQRGLKRLPWLIILLFASMLSGSVIGGFTEAISSLVALTFFIPTLIGTGGNAGTQSLAVAVRSLATGRLEAGKIAQHVIREVKIGLIIALLCGLAIGLISFAWQGTYILGVIVGTAMSCTILMATFLGTIIPIIINYLGADPAVAAGPFITTLVDVSGLLIYFGLAQLFLIYLT